MSISQVVKVTQSVRKFLVLTYSSSSLLVISIAIYHVIDSPKVFTRLICLPRSGFLFLFLFNGERRREKPLEMARFIAPGVFFIKGANRSEKGPKDDNVLTRFIGYFSQGINTVIGVTEPSASNRVANSIKIKADAERNNRELNNNEKVVDWLRELREEELGELNAAFAKFDLDDSGSINRSELRDVLRSLGHNPTEYQVHEVMVRADLDGSGCLSKDEFLRFMAFHFSFCDIAEDLRPVFALLTRDCEKTNGVKVKDAKRMLIEYNVDPDWTRNDEKELFEGFPDEEQILSFDEFVFLITGHRGIKNCF